MSRKQDKLDTFKKESRDINKRLLELNNRLVSIKETINEMEDDKYSKPVECCGKFFYFDEEYQKHRSTTTCRKKRGEPFFACSRCHRIFCDGFWSENSLRRNQEAYDKSKFKKHCINCPSYCEGCGVFLSCRKMVLKHKNCIEKKEKDSDTESNISMCITETETETEEDSDSDIEIEEWLYNGVSYGVDGKHRVYDFDSEEVIGLKHLNKIVKYDNDLFNYLNGK